MMLTALVLKLNQMLMKMWCVWHIPVKEGFISHSSSNRQLNQIISMSSVFCLCLFAAEDISSKSSKSWSFGLLACGWPLARDCQTRSRHWYQVVDSFLVIKRILIDTEGTTSVLLPAIHRRRWTGRARYFHRLIQLEWLKVSNTVARSAACTHCCLSDCYRPWRSTHKKYACTRPSTHCPPEMLSGWIHLTAFHASHRGTQPLSKLGHLVYRVCSRVNDSAVSIS